MDVTVLWQVLGNLFVLLSFGENVIDAEALIVRDEEDLDIGRFDIYLTNQ